MPGSSVKEIGGEHLARQHRDLDRGQRRLGEPQHHRSRRHERIRVSAGSFQVSERVEKLVLLEAQLALERAAEFRQPLARSSVVTASEQIGTNSVGDGSWLPGTLVALLLADEERPVFLCHLDRTKVEYRCSWRRAHILTAWVGGAHDDPRNGVRRICRPSVSKRLGRRGLGIGSLARQRLGGWRAHSWRLRGR